MRTIFMGTPEFAVPTLEALAEHTSLQLVITQPDRRQGRGKKLMFSPVKNRALELGINVIGPEVVKGKRFADKIGTYRPDLIVTAAFGRILGQSLLETPRYGCLNVHASLLPLYRGAAPINWAIINGEQETGVSIMRTVRDLDAGDVYTVKRIPILKQTAGELTTELAQLGAHALLETLQNIDSIIPVPQNHAKATFAPIMSKHDGRMNWRQSADVLERQVRGMHPWPGTYALWNGEPVKIHSVCPVDALIPDGTVPGTVVAQTLAGVDVACGGRDTLCRIRSLQMPGKKRLDASQFYAGLKFPTGSRFE
ncbi:MAG: methionyl-tRNA formyltransferase [Deltaproteobacteria bacterium]|nr:methionyl-tRNA formyltransferase [Deltaproteobacteria bacterium]